MASPRLIVVDGRVVGITDPEKQQSIPIGDSTSSRTSRTRSTSKKPETVYESEKLQQSFTSKASMEKAEREFEQKQQEQKRQEQIQEVKKTQAVEEQQPQFSGRVARIGEEGRTEQERFFVRGRETGRIKYEDGKPTGAITKKPSRFTFTTEREGFDETAEFDAEGAVFEVSRSIKDYSKTPSTSQGALFLKKSEAESLGIEQVEASESARVTAEARSIAFAERLLGKEEGESGVVAVKPEIKEPTGLGKVTAGIKTTLQNIDRAVNRREEPLSTPERTSQIVKGSSYRQLLATGQLPKIPIKFSRDVATGFVAMEEFYTLGKNVAKTIISEKTGLRIPFRERKGSFIERIERRGEIGGDILLFSGLSPVTQTSVGMSRQLAREGQRVQFAQLDKQLIKPKEVTLGTGGTTKYISTVGSRRVGGLKQTIELAGKATKSSQKQLLGLRGKGFVIPKADVVTTTRGTFDYTLRDPAGRIVKDRIFSIETSQLGVKGIVGGTDRGSVALSKIVRVGSRTDIPEVKYGFGFSKRVQAQVTPLGKIQQTAGFEIIPKTGRRVGDITSFRLKLKTRGLAKDFVISKKDVGKLGFQGGGKKSSAQFFKQLYGSDAQAIASSVMSGIKKTIKPMSVAKPITTPVKAGATITGARSAYAGTGLYERTPTTSYSTTSIMGRTTPRATPRTTSRTRQEIRQTSTPSITQSQGIMSLVSSISRSAGASRQRQPQKTRLIEGVAQAPIQKQIQPQIPKTRMKELLKPSFPKASIYSGASFFTPSIKGFGMRTYPKIPKLPPLFPKVSRRTKKKTRKKKAEDVELTAQDYVSKQLRLKRWRLF